MGNTALGYKNPRSFTLLPKGSIVMEPAATFILVTVGRVILGLMLMCRRGSKLLFHLFCTRRRIRVFLVACFLISAACIIVMGYVDVTNEMLLPHNTTGVVMTGLMSLACTVFLGKLLTIVYEMMCEGLTRTDCVAISQPSVPTGESE